MTTQSRAAIHRRDFLKSGLLATAVMAMDPWTILAEGEGDAPKVDVWFIKGPNRKKQMLKALEIIHANGGFGSHVDTLTLKVNAAWARTPEQAANTHPDLVDVFLKGCRDVGIQNVVVPENPCNSPRQSFPRSGIEQVVKKNDAKMIDLKSKKDAFVSRRIPHGKNLQDVQVGREFIETDALVNMPIAKHHGGATLSMAMKNWMGAVEDRGFWHRNNLHQCIADFSSFIRPDWTLLDATRIMLDQGPAGPSKNMRTPELLILSRDQVAVDVCACRLFNTSIDGVKYLQIARSMGLGTTDLEAVNLHQVTA
ncbi:MAG: DUF362 domain-containing protein [Spartobacteria bacterium]|nr:DUF362 domain-containing protein [Spartobacteria bacterium]